MKHSVGKHSKFSQEPTYQLWSEQRWILFSCSRC